MKEFVRMLWKLTVALVYPIFFMTDRGLSKKQKRFRSVVMAGVFCFFLVSVLKFCKALGYEEDNIYWSFFWGGYVLIFLVVLLTKPLQSLLWKFLENPTFPHESVDLKEINEGFEEVWGLMLAYVLFTGISVSLFTPSLCLLFLIFSCSSVFLGAFKWLVVSSLVWQPPKHVCE